MGDIGKEFGNLPDGPEDLPLEELGKVLGINFGGDFGKTTSSLIARFDVNENACRIQPRSSQDSPRD